jgi:hypothetical protein
LEILSLFIKKLQMESLNKANVSSAGFIQI